MALGDRWLEVGPDARKGIAVGAILIVVLTFGLSYWAFFGERYTALFSQMDPRETSAVVAQLERLKIDYKLSEDETEILVPEGMVHQVRMKMISAGVPQSGGMGFELFDNSKFGMTEFEKKINYQRALQGELARTIESLEEVKRARVHLAMPESGLFKKADIKPTASVTLFLKEGRQIKSDQIEGIQRLVSASVPDLESSRVSISDQHGRVLTRFVEDENGTGITSGVFGKKQEIESYLSEKAMRMLEHAYGPNQGVVTVDVTLDFDQVQRTVEDVVSPAGGENRGVVRRRESRVGTGAENQPNSANVTSEVEYKLGRKVEQTNSMPGRILRMSVGVMVPAFVDQYRRDDIRQLVSMAVGLNQTRGDAIMVHSAGRVAISGGGGYFEGGKVPRSQGEDAGGIQLRLSDRLTTPREDDAPLNMPREFKRDSSAYFRSHWQPWGEMIVGGVLALVAVLFLARWVKSRRAQKAQARLMSPVEREKLAVEVEKWLKEQ